MHDEGRRYSTHPKAVAGIILMASLMLFSVVFSLMIALAAIIAPIETRTYGAYVIEPTFSDYLSSGRVLFAAGIAAFVTGGFWFITPDD